ncbi:MAG: cupredoxin family copper-binding protein [Candidatus Velthaea sp.]
MRTLRIATLVLAILAPLAAGHRPNAAAATTPSVTVHIMNFSFTPRSLAIPAGTTVTFVNDDKEPHTVTATDKSFDSDGLDLHQSWKHAFQKSGAFAYYCEMHPYMKGKIVVTGARTP